MWLNTPEMIENILLESQLEPIESSHGHMGKSVTFGYKSGKKLIFSCNRGRKVTSYRGRKLISNPIDRKDLPIISIGEPEHCELNSFYEPLNMPSFVKAQLGDSDFYLIRLCCSFRPLKNEKFVVWASLVIELHSDVIGRKPIAFDLYPIEVTNEVKKSIKLTLSPTLKFKEIEGNLGSGEFGLEYPELQPVITAAGVGEATLNWDYEKVKGMGIQGSKFMYMLLKAPKGMRPIEASLHLQANVKIRDHLLSCVLSKKDEDVKLTRVDLLGGHILKSH